MSVDKSKIKVKKKASEGPSVPVLTEIHRHAIALSRALEAIRQDFPDHAERITADVRQKLRLTNSPIKP